MNIVSRLLKFKNEKNQRDAIRIYEPTPYQTLIQTTINAPEMQRNNQHNK